MRNCTAFTAYVENYGIDPRKNAMRQYNLKEITGAGNIFVVLRELEKYSF